MADFYRILGVSRDADAGEITRAYRQLARRHHPDVSGEAGGRRFQEIRQAYEAITAERRREARRGHPPAGARVLRTDGPEAWLSDEVAIDFPSIDAILDRIRRSFFGPTGAPASLRAEIELTPEEARRGVVVPLAVPVRYPCDTCAGRAGDLWPEWCAACGGTGSAVYRHHLDLSVPPGVADGVRLRVSLTAHRAHPTLLDIRIAVR